MPFLRQVVSGLVLDVPFYLTPHHKKKMLGAVVVRSFPTRALRKPRTLTTSPLPDEQKDANRIYRLFCARNPAFVKHGRVSIIAHSLGSTLCTDILSTQPTFVKPLTEMTPEERRSETQFVFDTRVLILVGSPVRCHVPVAPCLR